MSDANTASIHGTAFRAEIDSKLLKALAAEPVTANTKELYNAFSHVARNQLARRWVNTQAEDRKNKLNDALTIGTEDGANIEIRDHVGAENIFIFGNTTPQVEAIRKAGYNPRTIFQHDPMLKETLDKIDGGFFSPNDRKRYHDLFNSLVNYGDHYLLLADYAIDTPNMGSLLKEAEY